MKITVGSGGGASSTDNDEVEVSQISKRGIFGPFGRYHGIRENWVINGIVRAADFSALKTKMDARETMFNQKDYDRPITLYQNNGTTVVHQLTTTASRNGVRIKDFKWINAPFAPNAQGVNKRSYYALVENEYYDASQSGIYLWKETIEQIGSGGADLRVIESFEGFPEDQILKAYTSYMARQYGSAIGLLSHPTPPLPIVSGSLLAKSQVFAYSTAEWPGALTDMLYPIRWSYAFIATTAFNQVPVFP